MITSGTPTRSDVRANSPRLWIQREERFGPIRRACLWAEVLERQLACDVAQGRGLGVALGDDPLGRGNRPFDGDLGIVVGERAVGARLVVAGLLVTDVGD